MRRRAMRPLSAIAGLVLLAGLLPTPSRADGPAPGAPAAGPAAAPGCRCPGVRHVHRVYHRHVRHYRVARRPVRLVTVAPLPYNAPIPSPWDPAYDRGMVL